MLKRISVGSEIDSYCGSCKLVLNHAVVAMVEEQPRRVRCLTCQREHNYRLLKSKSTASKTKSTRRTARTSSKKTTSASKWNHLIAEWDEGAAKRYSMYETFSVNDWIDHATFGKGAVIEVSSHDRMITLFESGEKMLMHGKKRA